MTLLAEKEHIVYLSVNNSEQSLLDIGPFIFLQVVICRMFTLLVNMCYKKNRLDSKITNMYN